ncbi:MAG: M23 family metallopeptidase [Chitinispirillales bacterium]|nr:M23 family metallopeptidase [Chitinispirillales bacterium]
MRSVRVSLWIVIALVLMAAVGVAGYFVPLNRLILTEQERSQKSSLMEQNERLHNNIGSTLKHLSALKERTARLEEKREQHKDTIGLPKKPLPIKPPQKTPAVGLSSAAVLRHIGEYEKAVANFVDAMVGEGRGLFDTVPVCRPVSSSRSIVSKQFGMDRDPFTGKQKMHYGTDLAAEAGVPVVATAVGIVTMIENDPVWGHRVTVTHGRGFKTVYAHLGSVRTARGRTVARGDEIGTVGMSGMTTGPHLHYELWLRDKQLNPEEYFFPEAVEVAAR